MPTFLTRRAGRRAALSLLAIALLGVGLVIAHFLSGWFLSVSNNAYLGLQAACAYDRDGATKRFTRLLSGAPDADRPAAWSADAVARLAPSADHPGLCMISEFSGAGVWGDGAPAALPDGSAVNFSRAVRPGQTIFPADSAPSLRWAEPAEELGPISLLLNMQFLLGLFGIFSAHMPVMTLAMHLSKNTVSAGLRSPGVSRGAVEIGVVIIIAATLLALHLWTGHPGETLSALHTERFAALDSPSTLVRAMTAFVHFEVALAIGCALNIGATVMNNFR